MIRRIQQESIKRRLVKLAAPIFVETLLIMMLGAVDTIIRGLFLSVVGIA